MLTNSVDRPSARANRSAISTSNPTSRSGRDGSASTKGAPPSGSPAQRSTCGSASLEDAEKAASADAKAPAKNRHVTRRRAAFLLNRRVFVSSWGTAPRGDTVVDSTRRRFDGDCWISRNRPAGQRHGRTNVEAGERGDGVESHGVEGARARIGRRDGRSDTG